MEIGFHKSTEPFEFDESRWFVGEKPEVLDAFRVLSKEGYYIAISGHDYDMRKARLGRPTDKPSSDTPSTLNPALKEAASQFNEALLDEQGKKIAELTKGNERLKDQIAILDACKKHNDKIDRSQIKRLGKEISRLNKVISKKSRMIKDKDAVLSDVAEELRLSKVREEKLTEVCQKYLKEIEELRENLADKVVDKIDAQALKSAESALAYKEKVIAEKDEVIADLGKELKAKKALADHNRKMYDGAKINLNLRMKTCEKLDEEIEKLQKELEEKTKLVEIVRKGSKEYCEYGIAAEKMIQKMAKEIVNDSPVPSKDYKQYRLWANGYRFNPQLPDFSEEEEKKLEHSKKIRISCDIAEEGGDQSGKIVLCGKDFVKKFKENEEFVFDFFKNRAKEADEFMFIESGHLGGNGILDQMEDSNHPTEDSPEEVDMEEVLERVRKALEEGHTVSIDYKD